MATPRRDDPGLAIADDARGYESLLDGDELGPLTESVWSYQLDGAVFGPIAVRDLLVLLYDGKIDSETLVSSSDDEDFIALRRYGAFRNHLDRAEARLKDRAKRQAELEKAQAVLRKKQLRWASAWIGFALLLSMGVYLYVYVDRNERLELEEKARLEKEIAKMLAGVTIEPPLLPLVEEPSQSHRRKRGKRRRGPRKRTTGMLSEREIYLGLDRNFRGIVACIKSQLARDPKSVPESVVLEFVIDNKGRAKNLRMQDRFLRNSPLQTCLSDRLGSIQWRPFKGEVRNVVYPISVRRPS